MNRTHTRTMATLALLCAMEIVLARFCVIWITNSIKITFEAIPILTAGLLFGPVAGAVVGAVSDILGLPALRSGLAACPHCHPHPAGCHGRTAAPPGLETPHPARLLLVTGPGFVLGSMFWTTWWLSTLYGTPLPALLAVRVPLYCVIAVLDTLVLFFLCRSGVFRRLGLWPEQA